MTKRRLKIYARLSNLSLSFYSGWGFLCGMGGSLSISAASLFILAISGSTPVTRLFIWPVSHFCNVPGGFFINFCLPQILCFRVLCLPGSFQFFACQAAGICNPTMPSKLLKCCASLTVLFDHTGTKINCRQLPVKMSLYIAVNRVCYV